MDLAWHLRLQVGAYAGPSTVQLTSPKPASRGRERRPLSIRLHGTLHDAPQ